MQAFPCLFIYSNFFTKYYVCSPLYVFCMFFQFPPFFLFFRLASLTGLRVTTNKPFFFFDENNAVYDFETEAEKTVTSNTTTSASANDVIAVEDKSSGLCFCISKVIR